MNLRKLKWRIAQFFELWWWRFYFLKKSKAQYLNWKKRYWENVFSKAESSFPFQPSLRLLELGCGPAGCFIYLSGNNITAIDPLIDSYKIKLPFFSPEEYKNTTFISVGIEDVTLNEKFDVVLCFNAINHVRDIALCLNKIKNWLEPRGRVFLSVDAHNHIFLKRLFSAIPGDVLHPHQFTVKEYERLFEKAGLKIDEIILLKSEAIFSHYLFLLSANT